ncbi:MAG: hypothetical protein AVDCRST_MAG26-1334 [uncultured Chloroflexia bacterium]|uniref:Uncharacterized protein n=1 Tax=uncultured Chloroflexia bacterium TaxID=1672391 RepID=A0A6J4I3A0_9CHLR|nr:MAG: hypothetical protein AVDCRST_MAG26-1334 [uncultured Chloroflexia bacterium]
MGKAILNRDRARGLDDATTVYTACVPSATRTALARPSEI